MQHRYLEFGKVERRWREKYVWNVKRMLGVHQFVMFSRGANELSQQCGQKHIASCSGEWRRSLYSNSYGLHSGNTGVREHWGKCEAEAALKVVKINLWVIGSVYNGKRNQSSLDLIQSCISNWNWRRQKYWSISCKKKSYSKM